MDDRTARAVHWLADGRSASLMAPAIRVATSPAARDAVNRLAARDMSRLQEARDALAGLDVDRMRVVAARLGDDPQFRRGLRLAASRVQDAVEHSRHPRRRILAPILMVGAAVAAVLVVLKLMRRGGADDHRAHDGVAYSPASASV